MIKDSAARWAEIEKLKMPAQTAVSVLVAISKVEADFGSIDFSLKLSHRSRLAEGALGCCSVKDNTITLAKEFFKESAYETLQTVIRQTIKNKFHSETQLEVSSIVVHELCHAVWNTIVKKGVKLVDEVIPLMKKWAEDMAAQNKPFLMTYAATNICEFWAEMLEQELCGESDQYTHSVYELAHKYMDKTKED